ncbi:DUF305 domain-containing protein [Kocuria flava]|uniref:DUF305 domain-containing protein n=1 Tax=Kocuria flava TaxID=446860 RepID=A0A2N4SZS4_9MICC|nr:DUF305 domain-containing protein [Kocuria flava]PLC11436.1 DUF305 domain-containing protein [Kocuria flava]
MSTGTASTSMTGRQGRRVLLVVAAVLLAATGWAVGRLTAPTSWAPSEGSPEAGFARDMQTHHLQAVQMSSLVRDHTEDPEIRQLAYDISRTQQQQAGQMYGWLAVWGQPQASSQPAMAWMGEDSGHEASHGSSSARSPGTSVMPGMATPTQLTALEKAEGEEAEGLYLELMISHHQAGSSMATAILERTDNPAVTSLAQSIATSQSSEIEYMEGLLAER